MAGQEEGMKLQKWIDDARQVVQAKAAAVVKAITPTPPHRCDPTGFSCDCARRAFYNSGAHRGGGGWIPRRPGGWLR
jgi:hypothetical protein